MHVDEQYVTSKWPQQGDLVDIANITEDMLPFWMVETCDRAGTWHRFTVTPFATEAAVQRHIEYMAIEYHNIPTGPANVRATKYTKELWRQDLINSILADDDAMRRALSILRNSTLADLLK